VGTGRYLAQGDHLLFGVTIFADEASHRRVSSITATSQQMFQFNHMTAHQLSTSSAEHGASNKQIIGHTEL